MKRKPPGRLFSQQTFLPMEPAELRCNLDRNPPSSLSFPCPVCIVLCGIWSKLENLGFYAFSLFRNLTPWKFVDICHGLVQWKADLFPSLVRGGHLSPFNLDRTLLAVFLMSVVRSSSSCLVSEGEARGREGEVRCLGGTPASFCPQLPTTQQ